MPFHVKDLLDVAGLETSFGSWLMEGNVPTSDAECVRRMKAAGAILIGKTTTPEFADSVLTQSPHYGATANPWHTGYSSGGSSGGAAAAVAAWGKEQLLVGLAFAMEAVQPWADEWPGGLRESYFPANGINTHG